MPALRVLTWNIGSLLEPWWDERRHELVRWIDEARPDVCCLQECWEPADDPAANTGRWLLEQATGDWHVAAGGDVMRHGGAEVRWGSVIGSRWPIEQTRYRRLGLVPGTAGYLADYPWELFSAVTAGLHLYSTHLAPAPSDGHHRLVQVGEIDDAVRTDRGSSEYQAFPQRARMPSILCGDFNAEPDSDEMRFLAGLTLLGGRTTFWQDAWRVAGEPGAPGYTQDWRTHEIAAGLNVHRKRIDYVWVGDPFMRVESAGRVRSATVVGDHALLGGHLASDHSGLLVEIEWPSRPA